jgi:hypothetical protein
MPNLGDRLNARFEELEPEGEEKQWASYPPPDIEDMSNAEDMPDDEDVELEPDDEDVETEVKDYSDKSLRAAQLANYERQQAGGHDPIIADRSEEDVDDEDDENLSLIHI